MSGNLFIAKKGPRSIRVYREGETSETGPLVATIRLADNGGERELLRLYGYRVLGEWDGGKPIDTAVLVPV